LNINDTEKKDIFDQLRQNYNEMNEIGKEKLKEVSDKILEIWDAVNKNT
jgi:hypothetical protein